MPREVAWGLELPGQPSSNLLPLKDGQVVLAAGGLLLSVSSADGGIAWRTPLETSEEGRIELLAGGPILFRSRYAQTVGAYDPHTGKRLWSQSGNGQFLRPEGLWLLSDGTVSLLEPATGAVITTLPVPRVTSFAPEQGRIWFATATGVGAYSTRVLFEMPLKDAVVKGPGVVVQNQTALFLDPAGNVLARREIRTLYAQEDFVMDVRDQKIWVYNRQGNLVWKREVGWNEPLNAGPDRIELSGTLLRLHDGKVLARNGGMLALGNRLYEALQPDLLVHQGGRTTRIKGVFTGYDNSLRGTTSGNRVLLLAGSTLVALGEGPGTIRFGGPSEVSVSADTPQVPPRLSFTVSGRYLRGANVEVLRNGQVVARKRVPLRAGYQGDSMGVAIKVPDKGDYRVIARAAGKEGSTEVTLTDLAMLGLVSPARLYVQLQSLATGKPIQGGAIQVEGVGEATTDARGEASLGLGNTPRKELTVQARYQGQTLTTTAPVQAASVQRVYLQTDRPLYRPGQKLFFRGVVMQLDEDGQRVVPGTEIATEIRDAADNKLLDTRLTTDEFGVIAGELTLPAGAPLGRASLRAGADTLPFDIQEFRKPPYLVEVRSTQPLWIGGQNMAWEIKASYFFGGPVGGAEVRWRLEAADLYDSDDDDPLARDYRSYRDFVTEGTTTLDAQGLATIRLPAPKRERDARYTLTATVLGGEGREVEGSASTLVAVGDYGITARAGNWVQPVGQPMTIKIRTFDLLRRPHAATGTVVGYDGYSKKRRQFEVPFRTGADGTTTVTVTPRRAGYLNLELTSKDPSGHRIEGWTWVWITGADASDYSYPSLQIVPSKTTARPGETIRVLLLADKPGTVWLTVEGNRVFRHQVVTMKGKTATVELPVTAEFAPDVLLRAVMPRVDTSVNDSITLRVPLEQHRLKVELTKTQTDYRPGKTAELTITTGQRSSVALALVDEALYALRPEYAGDIHKFFHEERPLLVSTFEAIPRRPWVAGFQTIDTSAPVRENFQDTAYWNARLLTDENGVARVQIPLPDNLTTWRATARAVAPPSEVGQATTQLLVRLPVMVQSYAPRFLVHKDQSDVKTLAYNRTPEPQTIRLQVEPEGARALEGVQAEASVAPDASTELRTRIEVESQTEVKLLARAQAGAEGDAERIKVPVKPFGLPREEYFAGVLGAPTELDYRLPEDAVGGKLELRMDGSIASVIGGTLVYLADYPYGCVEQTMSRFGPTLVAGKAMETLKLPSPVPPTELQAMVNASLQALYGYQHGDGGWGWWKDDETNAFLTGYVISGLVRCQEAGWTVDQEVLTRGIASAREQLEAASSPETRAYLAWALALAGQAPVDVLTQLTAEPKLSTYSRALVALGLQKAGQKPDLSGLRALVKGDHWEAQAPTAYGWTDDNLEATCLVLQALLGDNPQDPLLPGGVSWVLGQRRGDQWKSTKDSAVAVFFLADYLRARGQTSGTPSLTATLDGQPVTLAESRASLDLGPGRHHLTMTPGDSPIVSARLRYVQAPGLDVLAAESRGIGVQRTYLRPGQRGPIMTPLHPQEDLIVELLVDTPTAMEYVMVEDPRAAGMEVPEQPVQGTNRFEIRDDRVVFFISYLPAGLHKFVYRQRAETPGRFQSLPARASLMYRPEVYGTSQSRPVEILRK